MALNISGYTDPGVIIGENVTPAGLTLNTVPDVLGIVAYGNRKKRSINEGVIRGSVLAESLTVAAVAPHTATLINTGNRRVANTSIRRTLAGQTITIPDTAVSYNAAQLISTDAGTYDISNASGIAIGISLDGKKAKNLILVYNAAPSPAAEVGSVITVEANFSGASGNAATRAEVAQAINDGLVASTDYGAAYNAVATDETTGVGITSPLTTPVSDVQVLTPFIGAGATAPLDGTATIGFADPIQAVTVVEITAAFYDGSATYEADYVATDTDVDPLVQTATGITRIGSFANVTSFTEVTDYQLTGGDVDWSVDTAATFADGNTQNFDVSTNDLLNLAFDGKASVQIDLNGLVSPPAGYDDPAAPAAATAAEIANNINAVISSNSNYGPLYRAVAADVGGKVVLTSPMQGATSSVEISAPTATDATNAIFGLSGAQLPKIVLGTGARPTTAVLYFVTYEFDRLSADYNTPKRYFTEDQMVQDLTPVSAANLLSTYAQIAFDNDAPSLVISQVDDATTPGFPTVNEVTAALDGLENSSITTDVVVADTRLNVQTALLAHVENQSSPTEKNFRTGWFGMPASTAIGDKDTPDTFVYRAGITLQVAPDSPARGRLILVAPTGAKRTITNEDGSETTLTLDSTAVACAVAARHTSFTSPAVSLAAKNIVGFDVTEFPTFIKSERAELASNGVFVVTSVGGRLNILDPITTERAGGGLAKFLFRSTSSQKDNVTRAVDQTVDANLRGVVPDDLADFIFDIKTFVSQAITSLISSGAIGPFRDDSGATRDINLSKDVQAEQDPSDPTKFRFRYFYFLRYPALRFEGEFSVDNPFF